MDRISKRPLASLWMQLLAFVAVTGVAGIGLPPAALAQSINDVRLLSEREKDRLPVEARKTYEKAVKALDHVDPDSAVKYLADASELAPEAIELHFLTARVAQLRARRVFGSAAVVHYEIAEETIGQIQRQEEDLSPLEKRRLDTLTDRLSKEKKRLAVRDEYRLQAGRAFRQRLAKEREAIEQEGERKRKRKLVVGKTIHSSQRPRRTRPPGGGPDGMSGDRPGGPGGMPGGPGSRGFPPTGGPFGGRPPGR